MRLDRRAVAFGAAIAIAIAVPPQLVFQALVSTDVIADDSALAFPFSLVQIAGFVLGGFVAGRKRPDAPLSHGAVAAVTAFVLVQAIGVLFIAVRGDDVSVLKIAFGATVSLVFGMIGGVIAGRSTAAAAP